MSWRVSPSARKLKALSPEFPEVKFQVNSLPSLGSADMFVMSLPPDRVVHVGEFSKLPLSCAPALPEAETVDPLASLKL